MAKGESITITHKNPFRQVALTISANDNNKIGAKGVRSFTPQAATPPQRMFNNFSLPGSVGTQVGTANDNRNSPWWNWNK